MCLLDSILTCDIWVSYLEVNSLFSWLMIWFDLKNKKIIKKLKQICMGFGLNWPCSWISINQSARQSLRVLFRVLHRWSGTYPRRSIGLLGCALVTVKRVAEAASRYRKSSFYLPKTQWFKTCVISASTGEKLWIMITYRKSFKRLLTDFKWKEEGHNIYNLCMTRWLSAHVR